MSAIASSVRNSIKDQDPGTPAQHSSAQSPGTSAEGTLSAAEHLAQFLGGIVEKAPALRARAIQGLEARGLQYARSIEIGGSSADIYANQEHRLLVFLHNAATIGENAAGSVNVTLVGEAPYWTYHLSAPDATAIRSAAIRLLEEDPRKLAQLTSQLEAAKHSTQEHEATHIACMASGTPWGKIMFTHLLHSEIDRMIEARDSEQAESAVNISLNKHQASLLIEEGVSKTDYHAALLISELRAHMHNFASTPERADAALKCFVVIERCLEICSEKGHPQRDRAEDAMGKTLAEWQRCIAHSGYDFPGSDVVDRAKSLLLESGSLRTPLDPPLQRAVEEWMKSVSQDAALKAIPD